MDRVTEPDDPSRCTSTDQFGQCWNVAAPGHKFCPTHQGRNLARAEEVRQYQLTDARLRQRLAAKSEHEEIKSLRDEIGLTRILIETLMNNCKDEIQLLAACGQFNQLALTLERLIKTSHQMEQSLGTLLSKPTIIVLGQDIVKVLIDELQGVPNYEERIDRITGRMLDCIDAATNKSEE